MPFSKSRFWMGLAVLAAVLPALGQVAGDGNDFTEQQKAEFLRTAQVIKSKQSAVGVTNPFRLTLSDGTVTHDGNFQAVDISKTRENFSGGRVEYNFKDSYKYNIAAYQLAKLIGMDDMVPVTVERRWDGKTGSISWWIPNVAMDERARIEKQLRAPDADAWNKQMNKVRVFDELIYDTDANLTNVLITRDWKIWRIDFSRAFRTWKQLRHPENLEMCDKGLLEKMKALTEKDLKDATQGFLTGAEVKGVMSRRDLIVQYFNKLVAQKGEGAVLY